MVLITIDALRPDHLTPYGYERETSPFLHALAGESFVFTDAIAQCGTTGPSISSLMSGLFPYTDNLVVKNGPFVFLKRRHPTLAEELSKQGYRTHAITSSIQTSTVTGVNRGFETFDAIRIDAADARESRRRNAEQVTDRAIDWLDQTDSGPFFLWLHYLDPHLPYRPPREYEHIFSNEEPLDEGAPLTLFRSDEPGASTVEMTEGELARAILDYDREIRYTDDQMERLFREALAQRLERTIVVITSDHGESLGEHGILTHNGLYQSILRVPLIFRLPGASPTGRRIDDPVMLVDLFPTLFDLLDARMTKPSRGRSLEPLLTADPDSEGPRLRLAEYENRQAILYRGLKLITHGKSTELYDLRNDEGEQNDLSGRMKEVQALLLEEARRLKKTSTGASSRPADLPQITPEMLDELEALGYVAR